MNTSAVKWLCKPDPLKGFADTAPKLKPWGSDIFIDWSASSATPGPKIE